MFARKRWDMQAGEVMERGEGIEPGGFFEYGSDKTWRRSRTEQLEPLAQEDTERAAVGGRGGRGKVKPHL